MTWNRKALREIADEKGFLYRAGRKSPIARIYEDGDILRMDVRLDLATPMTVKDAVKLLELKS